MTKYDFEGRDGSLEEEHQSVQALALLALAECGTAPGRGESGLAWLYSGKQPTNFLH